MASSNAAEVHNGFFASIGGLLLPVLNPFHDGAHQLIHSANGIHFLASFAKRSVHVNSSAGDTNPERSKMLENDVSVGRFAEDAHVGQDAVIYQIVRAISVAAIFLALEVSPLRFFDFSCDGCNDHIAFETHTRTLQGL